MADPGDAPALVQSTAPGRHETHRRRDDGGADQKVKAPWHFWVLVAAVVIYLGWRLIQLIGLLF